MNWSPNQIELAGDYGLMAGALNRNRDGKRAEWPEPWGGMAREMRRTVCAMRLRAEVSSCKDLMYTPAIFMAEVQRVGPYMLRDSQWRVCESYF